MITQTLMMTPAFLVAHHFYMFLFFMRVHQNAFHNLFSSFYQIEALQENIWHKTMEQIANHKEGEKIGSVL